jgi:putative PIN family toxin of toxin-antitoxin system
VRAVLDTNVLVAGLRTRRGASFQLLRLARARRLIPVISVPLFFEYEDVLSRSGILPNIPAAAVGKFLDAFLLLAEPHEIHFLWRPMLADPKDEMLVELAMAAGGNPPLITFNARDFTPATQRLGLRVLTPSEAVRMLSLPCPP